MSDTDDLVAAAAAASSPDVAHLTDESSNNEDSDATPTPTACSTDEFDRTDTLTAASRQKQSSSPSDANARVVASASVATASAHTTNSNVVASHYNTLEEKGLAERQRSRILHMRNYNNWIKSTLINEYITRIRDASKLGAPLRVLDMCCGKGGDLYKWEKAHITHLICTDIAAVSVEQCEARYATLSERHLHGGGGCGGGKFFTAEFFACDATRTRLRNQYADPSVELNLVSCQFAFHYCFESLQQAECMIKNAAECLRTGGYFIGTIPDAFEIVRRQRLASGASTAAATSFGNEVFEIGFLCDTDEPPLFGGKYNFKLQGVVDCPEFLVHFPLLVKLARKFGLQLVMREGFGPYGRRMMETCEFDCFLIVIFY